MKKAFLSLVIFCVGWHLSAQVPVITGIDKKNAYTKGKIVITGTGFNADSTKMAVWFGGAEGKVLSSTTGVMEVQVPVMAHASQISVLNRVSKAMTISKEKFFHSFSGGVLDPYSFSQQVNMNAGTTEYIDLCECDVNKDSLVDVIVSVARRSGTQKSLEVLINKSTPGTLVLEQDLLNYNLHGRLSYSLGDVRCADMNGDNWPDLVAVSKEPDGGGFDGNRIYVFPNNAGTFGSPIAVFMTKEKMSAERLAINDLDYDGKPDLIVSSKLGYIRIYKNISSGATISFDEANFVDYQLEGGAFGMEIQDLDNDNRPEIIAVIDNATTSGLAIFRNQSTQTKLDFQRLDNSVDFGYLVRNIVGADFNKDGLLDIAATGQFDNEVIVLRNSSASGAIQFAAPYVLPTVEAPSGLDIGDLDGNGTIDLAVGSIETNNLHMFLNESSGDVISFAGPKTITTTGNPRNVLINDLDGDAKPDLAFTSIVGAGFGFEAWRNGNCYIPIVFGGSPQKICPTQTIDVTAVPSPGSTFEWSLDGATVKTGTDPFIGVTAIGTLSLKVTQEANACVKTAANQIVFQSGAGTVPGDPTIDEVAPVCENGTIQLQANVDASIVGTETYEWTYPDGSAGPNIANPTINNATVANAGIYSVKIKVGDCLSSEITRAVEVYSFPTLFIESTVTEGLCEGQSTTLKVPTVGGLSYVWQVNGVDDPAATGNTYTVSTGGDYTVKVTSGAPFPTCTTLTETFPLITIKPPVADFSTTKTTFCAGEAVEFANVSTVDTTQTVVYAWEFGDGQLSDLAAPLHTYDGVGSYSAGLTVYYDGIVGCTHTTAPVDLVVTQAIAPKIIAEFDSICFGAPNMLSIENVYDSITWSTGVRDTSMITVDYGDTFFVETKDVNGCPGYADYIVYEKEPANLILKVDTTTTTSIVIQEGDSVEITASGAFTYSWTPLYGLSDSTSAIIVAKPDTSVTYLVVGYSIHNCTDTLEFLVEVHMEPGVSPWRAFSPNGDGIDDLWPIKGALRYPDCNLRVFDIRGRIVYEQEGGTYIPWDGRQSKGGEVPVGVYYYVISFPESDVPTKKGSVFVAR